MGASALMSLGMRAMSANYAALQATGHNISNVNTEGYSRQRAALTPGDAVRTAGGLLGSGVRVIPAPCVGRCEQGGHEWLGNLLVDQDALDRLAGLARREAGGPQDGVGSLVEVGIRSRARSSNSAGG